MLHGVDTGPLNVVFTHKHNVHFVRISKLVSTVRHASLLPWGRHRSRVVAVDAGVQCGKTAVFGDGTQGAACSGVCELPTLSAACSSH